MPHRRIRKALAAALLVIAPALALAGCGAGNDAETLQIAPDTPATTLGSLKVQNVVLVSPAVGRGGPLAVTGSIFNGGTAPDQLQQVGINELPQPAVFTPTPQRPEMRIGPNESLQLGGPGNATAVVPNPADLVTAGQSRRVTFRFARQGEVTLWVPVQPATGIYAGFGPVAAIAGQ